jgi:Rod binding domain-containing protein
MMTDPILNLPPPRGTLPKPEAETRLHKLAQDLEATFLSEMLVYAGLGQTRDAFGGGAGEEQFASFLRQEQATAMVKAGGIGLAESLFRAMERGQHVGT